MKQKTLHICLFLLVGFSLLGLANPAAAVNLNVDCSTQTIADALNANQDARIVFRHSTSGKIAVWDVDHNLNILTGVVQDSTLLDWKVVGSTDVNGDGQEDIIFRNSATGGVAIWTMDGFSKSSTKLLGTAPDLNWKIHAVGPARNRGLTIIITGTCIEDVLIDRKKITLKGATQAATVQGTILVKSAHKIVIDNLTVQNPSGDGIDIRNNSSVDITNVIANGSSGRGLRVKDSSRVGVVGGTFSNNGLDGIRIEDGSVADLSNVTVAGNGTVDNGRHGLMVHTNSYVNITDSSFTSSQTSAAGGKAMFINRNSTVSLNNDNTIANDNAGGGGAFGISHRSSVRQQQTGVGTISSLNGARAINVDHGSYLELRNFNVTGDVRLSDLSSMDAIIHTDASPGVGTFTGDFKVQRGSTLSIWDHSKLDKVPTITGTITCNDTKSTVELRTGSTGVTQTEIFGGAGPGNIIGCTDYDTVAIP